MRTRALVDGRAFSHARDDERTQHVRTLVRALRSAELDVSLLLFDGCRLEPNDPVLVGTGLRHAPFPVAPLEDGLHGFTHVLSRMLEAGGFDLYVDASPDLPPHRLELPTAATLAMVADPRLTDPPVADDRRHTWQNAILRIDRAEGLILSGAVSSVRMTRFFGRAGESMVRLQGDLTGPALRTLAMGCVTRHQARLRATEVQIFSSLPGAFCGVADFTVGHLRAHKGESALHFSHGDPGTVARLRARLFSHLDFALTTARVTAPRLFHVATSVPLLAGMKLLRHAARAGDIALIHERRYFDGFRHVMTLDDSRAALALDFFPEGEEGTQLARRTLGFSAADAERGPMATWLSRLPVALVSLLSPQVQAAAAAHRERDGSPARNDFASLEDRIGYVPLGLDDRAGPHLTRAARRLRTRHGVAPDALVVGHFGVIVDGHKLLREATDALLAIGQESGWRIHGRDLHVVLCGKRADRDLAEAIRAAFAAVGRADRLRFSNPPLEQDFETELAACDATFCLRLQAYGQQSHALVRALSLGVPTMVNRASGWSYDPATALEDTTLAADMGQVLRAIAGGGAEAMRRAARAHYDTVHRADITLGQLLAQGAVHAGA